MIHTRRFTKLALALGLIMVLCSPGCSVGPGRTRATLEFDGLDRSYLLHLPPAHGAARTWPLVIALHPFAGSGEGMAQTTGFDSIADEEGFIVCYPEGVTFLWNGDPTDETKGLLVEDADDVGFIGALIDHLIAEYDVDPARIYVTGASNGGLMTQRLACALSDRIAAAAPVMITLPEGFPEWCAGSSPVPMMMILGTEDPFFPWEGGAVQQGPSNEQNYLSAAETVAFWVAKNGALSAPTLTALPDEDPADGTRVYRESYDGGETGAPFVFLRVEGGGHTWPGSTLNLLELIGGVGTVSRDVDASRAIWEFFDSVSK